jgi:4-hydroxy-2-oxoheptanedioate aldolase
MALIRQRLAQAPVTFGTWLALATSHSAEVIGRAGFDWVIIDCQHGGVSEALLLPMLQALDLSGTPALVRVPWRDPALIMRALDLGAAGVVVPMVNSAADAEEAVRASRYPPRGMRSFGPVRSFYSAEGSSEDPLCIVMIETVEALGSVEEIAATPGLDGLLVGPVDLALSMGHGPALQMPGEVLDAIGTVAECCRRRGLFAASVSIGPDNATDQIARGVTFLTSGADSLFMRRGAEEEIQRLRGLIGPGK